MNFTTGVRYFSRRMSKLASSPALTRSMSSASVSRAIALTSLLTPSRSRSCRVGVEIKNQKSKGKKSKMDRRLLELYLGHLTAGAFRLKVGVLPLESAHAGH